MVYASNVLNVQSSPEMLGKTLDQIKGTLHKDGHFVGNLPESPRKFEGLNADLLKAELEKRFDTVKHVGGTKKAPIYHATGVKLNEEEDPCWDGYKQLGTKEKNGKTVPNCIKEEMTDAQMKRREDIVMGMKKNKDDLQKRYGDNWENVLYATATKMAMKEEYCDKEEKEMHEICSKEMEEMCNMKKLEEETMGGENAAGIQTTGQVAPTEAQPGVQPDPVVVGNFTVEGGEQYVNSVPGQVAPTEAQPGIQPQVQTVGNFTVEGGENVVNAQPQQPALMAEERNDGSTSYAKNGQVDSLEGELIKTEPDKAPAMTEEDLSALFGEELSEEFKEKVQTIFEAAVNVRIKRIEESLNTKYKNDLDEEVQIVENSLIENIDGSLDKVADKFIAENKVAIEKSVRVHLLEQFVDGIRNVLVENDISIEADKLDVVEALAEENQSLKEQLQKSLDESVQIKKDLADLKKSEIIQNLGERLVVTEFERFKELCESVSYASVEEFEKKATHLFESHFKGTKKAINEQKEVVTQLNEAQEKEKKRMQAYLETIKRTSNTK